MEAGQRRKQGITCNKGHMVVTLSNVKILNVCKKIRISVFAGEHIM